MAEVTSIYRMQVFIMTDLILDRERMPLHVAVIMDGNGRWAKKKGSAPSGGT